MRNGVVKLALAGAVLLAAATAAQARDEPRARPKLFQDALDCAAIKADAERLACYDRAVPVLARAENNKDILVTDRAQAREARRSLFGFRLPSLRIFGGDKDDDLDKLDTTINAASRGAQGQLILILADGAVWGQTDERAVIGKIKPGDKVTISRGVMGSYFATIPGRGTFKVERRR